MAVEVHFELKCDAIEFELITIVPSSISRRAFSVFVVFVLLLTVITTRYSSRLPPVYDDGVQLILVNDVLRVVFTFCGGLGGDGNSIAVFVFEPFWT